VERKGWKGDTSDGGASCTGGAMSTHSRSLRLRLFLAIAEKLSAIILEIPKDADVPAGRIDFVCRQAS